MVIRHSNFCTYSIEIIRCDLMKNEIKNKELYKLFICELKCIYNAEAQIIQTLPDLIGATTFPDLREALTNHLQQTQTQVQRLEKIFLLLSESAVEDHCKAIEGLLREAKDIISHKIPSTILDAAIIAATQKVEHYEMAAYGTLRSFAKNLETENEIINLLQETLDEEVAADKKLTKIAEGTFFSCGVNKAAASR